jgi:integrase
VSTQRQRGSGTIRKLKSGWQARYVDESGRQVPAPFTFQTKADANLWLADRLTKKARGSWLDPREGEVLLRDFGGSWLTNKPYTPLSRVQAEWLWSKHVEPELGSVSLNKISPSTVRTWLADRRKVTTPAVVRQAYNLLKAIMATAVSDDLIAKNPCQEKRASNFNGKRRPLMTWDQAAAILEHMPPHLRVLVATTWWSSMRVGEAVAIRWEDVDLEGGQVHVHRQIVQVGHDLIETPPKAHSDRFVALDAEAVALLGTHKAELGRVLPSARVFTNRKGLPLTAHAVGQAWRRARVKAGLPQYRFHDLRHGSATLAAQSGATLYEVMERLGHKSMNAALGYQHAAAERGSVIAASMAQMARTKTTAEQGTASG